MGLDFVVKQKTGVYRSEIIRYISFVT